MQAMYIWIAAALVVVAVGAAIAEGGAFIYLAPVLVLVALGIVIADRTAKAKRPEHKSDRAMNSSS